MKGVEFRPVIKFNLKENLLLSMKTYKTHNFFSIIEKINNVKNICVINITGNFHIKVFSLIVLQNRVKQKLYYQRINYKVLTHLMKVT